MDEYILNHHHLIAMVLALNPEVPTKKLPSGSGALVDEHIKTLHILMDVCKKYNIRITHSKPGQMEEYLRSL